VPARFRKSKAVGAGLAFAASDVHAAIRGPWAQLSCEYLFYHAQQRAKRKPHEAAIITTNSNELVADIHDRMPVILAPGDYDRWLGPEPDPRDLMRPFPAESMRMWPISTRVNKPENDDPSIIEPIEPATDAA
jgi:putative SOS response-associated peptidase YedK